MSGAIEYRRQTTVSKVSSSTLLNGIKAYYKLDEASGTVLDTVGSNDGTNYGATPNQVEAKIGTSYRFNGYDKYVDMGNTTDLSSLTGAGTIAFWLYPSVATSNGQLITKMNIATNRNGYRFYVASDGLSLRGGGASATAEYYTTSGLGPAITLSTWQLVGFSWDVSINTIKLFVNNGTPYLDTNLTITFASNVENFQISDNTYGGLGQNGYFDEIGIWNRLLTDAEILELYNSGTGKTYPFI